MCALLIVEEVNHQGLPSGGAVGQAPWKIALQAELTALRERRKGGGHFLAYKH